jgi:hypothetical protein
LTHLRLADGTLPGLPPVTSNDIFDMSDQQLQVHLQGYSLAVPDGTDECGCRLQLLKHLGQL